LLALTLSLIGLRPLSYAAAARADSVAQRIARMTLEERVGQLFIIRFWGTEANDLAADLIRAIRPGGVVLLKHNLGTPPDITRLTNGLQTLATNAAGIPLLITLDQEGGRIQRLREGFTRLPAPLLLGAVTDEAVLSAYGEMLGRELAAVGVNMNLAPSLDLATSPNNPVMRGRMYGDDGAAVGRVTNAIVRGLDRAQVVSVAKHFPGHGDASDTHVDGSRLLYDLTRLMGVELVPFAMTTAPVIMLSHIAVPALDPSALPATLSGPAIQFLRHDLGYDGVVMTDALDMGAISRHYGDEVAAVRAVQAGVDLLLLGAHVPNERQLAAYRAVLEAVRQGDISRERLDAAVGRILALKERYGLLAWQPLAEADTSTRILAAEGAALILEVYRAAITLARDEGGLLPFRAGLRLGLVYFSQHPQTPVVCAQAAGRAGSTMDALAVSFRPLGYQISQAAALASRADAVVVFTEDADETPDQARLVNALPADKTVVVALGSPYDWRTFPQVAGYALTYSDSPTSIEAACEALFGGRDALGALPVRLSAQLPAGARLNR
jgi:beta-N-acetylhexosaminidase